MPRNRISAWAVRVVLPATIAALAAGTVPSVSNAQAAHAAAGDCSISSVYQGTFSGSQITIQAGAEALVRFACATSYINPPLLAPQLGDPVTVSRGQQDGSLWMYPVSAPYGSGGTFTLRMLPPGTGAVPQDFTLVVTPRESPTPSPSPSPSPTPAPPPLDGVCTESPGVVKPGTNTRAQLLAREPGQSEFAEVPNSKLCAQIYSPADTGPIKQASVSVATTADGPWPYPAETTFRVVAKTEGLVASVGGGSGREPQLRVTPDGFVLQAKALWQPKITPQCIASPSGAFLSFAVTSSQTGATDRMQGSIGGSNAYMIMGPNLKFPGDPNRGNGSMTYSLTGCGDGNPSTIDGFLDSFLSTTFLQQLGISQSVLQIADGAAVTAMMSTVDNGKSVAATYAKERDLTDSSWGVRMLYRTSFSPHNVAIGSNGKAVAFSKSCAKQKKSRLRTTGKGKKRTLTCTPRKGKAKKLKVG